MSYCAPIFILNINLTFIYFPLTNSPSSHFPFDPESQNLPPPSNRECESPPKLSEVWKSTTTFVDLKSNSALLYNKGHNF